MKFFSCLFIAAGLCSAVFADDSLISLRCATPGSDGSTSFGSPIFLTAKEADIQVAESSVRVRGRLPKVVQVKHPELGQCRSTFLKLVDYDAVNDKFIYANVDRGWNVLAVRPAETTQIYVCGVGTQLSYFDTRAQWLDAMFQYYYGTNEETTISKRECLIDEGNH